MKDSISMIVSLTMLSFIFSCGHKAVVKEQKLPVDKDATIQAVNLYNRLIDLKDKGIMVGHQDDLAYGHAWYKEAGRSDIKDVVGDYPAVIGWELGHLELGADYNLDSVYFSDTKRYVKETHERGGITTFSWHGDNIVTGNTAWDCAQDSVVRSVLEGGNNHFAYMKWLGRLAEFFLDLKDKDGNNIPVIFRMYHEHTGDWFWWGSEQCSPDEYKQLWIMTLKYLRDVKNVHNLLYAYSPSETNDEAHYLERYPGDEYVDILAFDCYAYIKTEEDALKYMDKMNLNLSIVTEYAKKANKIATIGETGMESISDSMYFTRLVYPVISRYKISWVLFWRNAWEKDKPNHFYAPFKGHKSSKDFNDFVAMPDILMNKDIHKTIN